MKSIILEGELSHVEYYKIFSHDTSSLVEVDTDVDSDFIEELPKNKSGIENFYRFPQFSNLVEII